MSRRLPAPVAARLSAATRDLPAPLAVLDLDAFDANAATLVGRSHGRPIRIATKSLRSRPLIERALGRDGFAGLMCYAVREALWWARAGHTDLMVAYPSVDVPASDRARLRPGPHRCRRGDGRQHRARRLHRPPRAGSRGSARGGRRGRLAAHRAGPPRGAALADAHARRGRGGHPTSPGARPRRRRPDVLRRPDRRAARLLAGRAAGQGPIAPASCSLAGPRSSLPQGRSPTSTSSTAAAPAACTSPASTPRSPSSRLGPDSMRRPSSTATTVSR